MGKSAIMSVRITGNSDDAVKALSKVTAKASAFGTFMGGAALKGVSALWDTLKGFTSAVMDMSDSTDKFKNTMNFAGFDTSAVEAATKATREYADKTVYDLTTVQNTTAQLAANGIQDYVGLTEAAGNLNAVAGGNAETFKSVAMVMTQTAGAGKLTTENWNQLTDAIPGAAGKLQEAMLNAGAYTGNFREAMEKGEITADEFNKAIMDLGMTDVAKEAATSTQTMEGALGNLEAAVTGGLTDAFNLFKPAVTSAMTVAADKISAFSGKATTGLQGVIKLVRDGDFSSELREAFNIDEDSPVVDFLLTIRDNAVSAFDTAKQKAGEFVAAFQNTGPMQAAADIFGAVWEARPVTSSASSRRWRILWAARPAPARRWVTHSTALPISSAWFRTSSRRSATGYPSMRNPSRPRLWASRRVSPRSRSLRPSAPSCPRCRDSAWRPRPLLWRSGP